MTRVSRRQFGQWTALAIGVASLGGCAPWEQADPAHGLDRLTNEPTPTPLEWRVLNRLGYGPRPGDILRLRAQGVDAWIDHQLHPELIAETPELEAALAQLDTLSMSPEEARDRETDWEPETAISPLMEKVFKLGKRRDPVPGSVRQELVQATVLRAVFSARALQEVMVEFWSDHFSINQGKGDCRWLKTTDDRLMRLHAFGRFRDLLGASAHSPAMLFNLDNTENRKSGDPLGPHFNENYARELMELHTLGDTSAYSLRDIQEVARVLSGWTSGEKGTSAEGEFVFSSADHDDGEKIVLNQRFPAGQGQRDGEHLLDFLATHPLTARHIAGKLCDRFLGRVPMQLRDRLAKIFVHTQGDIRQVVGELARSDEFRSVSSARESAAGGSGAGGSNTGGSDTGGSETGGSETGGSETGGSETRGAETGSGAAEGALLKRPFQFAISALRMLGARTSGRGMISYLEAMGQRPFAWLQPNGYPLSPEYWSTGLLARWRFAVDLARNKIDQTWINLAALRRATQGEKATDVCIRLSVGLLPTPLSSDTIDALAEIFSSNQSFDPRSAPGLSECVALLIMSPHFQWC